MLGYRVVRSFFSSKTSENTRKHLSSKKTHDIPAARFLLQSSVICALTVRNTMFVPECLKVDARGPTKMVVWFRFRVQNCGDNIWIYRSTILIFSFHLFTSDWSNHVKPCFPPSEIEHQHVLLLWAAISACDYSCVPLPHGANFIAQQNRRVSCHCKTSCGSGLTEVPLRLQKVPVVWNLSGTKFTSTGTVPKPKEDRSVA